jgi:hypothetical protein
MSVEINYKKKYIELRSKYINDLDMAFRLGFEQGGQQAQQQQALDAQAQNQEAEQQQAMAEAGGMNGAAPQEGQQPGQEGQQPPGAEGGSELDQHISKLEGMLGKPEQKPEDKEAIQKSLEAIISLRKAEKLAGDMKKSELAIKGIAKALHKPAFKMGAQAQHNLDDNAKKSVTLQHKIVNDIWKSWKEEESKAGKDIHSILNVENLVKE